jgi:hypothetical protein
VDILNKTIPLINVACLKSFKSIEYLKLRELAEYNILHLSELLASLTNLKNVNIKIPQGWRLNDDQVSQFQLILDNLSRYECVRLTRIDEYTNCYQIQKKNPKVRFQWYMYSPVDRAIGKYEGNLIENGNNREGRGVFLCDGNRYEGEWKDDKQEGRGVMRYYDGSKYEGEWRYDDKEGKGIMIYSGGSKYEGEWKNDKMEGKGSLIYSDGDKYEGEWKNDKREGKGVMVYSDGSKYEGEWKNDRKEGKGIMVYYDGSKYEGEWRNDEQLG